MTDSMMSKAATMEIPINSNGDTGTLTEDDGLEQVGQVHSDGKLFSILFAGVSHSVRVINILL